MTLLISNFIFIFASIIVFISPFYALYRFRAYKNNEVKVGLNQHLEYFFSSKEANWLVFFWAMGEALLWFVIPEFLLLLIIFMRIKKKIQLLTYDIYGTATGIILALLFPLNEKSLANLPYVTDKMITQTHVWFEDLGVFALMYQPFSGVPFKVFNHLALERDLFLLGYIFFALLVRISRYALAYLVLVGAYNMIHKYVYKNYVWVFVIAVAIFSILLLRVSNIFGPDYIIQT